MRTPLMVGLGTVGLKLFLSLLLVGVLQHAGLTLATSITVLVNAFILSWLLQRRLPGLFDRSFFRFGAGALVASVVMGGFVYVLDGFLSAFLVGSGLTLAVRVGLDIACGALVLLAVAWLLRLDELRYLVDLVWDMVRRRAGTSVSK